MGDEREFEEGHPINAFTSAVMGCDPHAAKILGGLLLALSDDPAKWPQLLADLQASAAAAVKAIADDPAKRGQLLAGLGANALAIAKTFADSPASPPPAVAPPLAASRGLASTLTPVQRRLCPAPLDEEQELLFQHTVLCQTCLPYRDPGDDVRVWERLNGRARLKIIAGEAMHPTLNEYVPVGLPFGTKPRLVLMHLNAEAVRTGSPIIEVEDSLSAFVRRLKLDPKGRNKRIVKDQLARLSASSVRLGMVLDGRAITVNTQVVTAFELWASGDHRQRTLWPSTVQLSADYFKSLTDHAVPLDEHAIRALAHNAMALDIYAWLAQRLGRVPKRKPAFIAWATLQAQFGWHYNRVRQFRQVFLHTLRQVRAVYPEARVDEEINQTGQPAGLVLHHSPEPVARRTVFA